MFAVLGDIRFQVLGSPEAIDSRRAYTYAEHRVIEARPLLQWLADDLERLTFDLKIHASFADPAAELAALKAAASAHQALALVFGNGDFRGYFVIESIATRSMKLSAAGDPIAITVRLALKEWAKSAELNAAAPPIVPFVPLAVVAAAVGSSAPGALAIPFASAPLAIPAASAPGALAIPLSSAGLSALFKSVTASGALGPDLAAADVPAAAITRSIAR
jgi:phage protein U